MKAKIRIYTFKPGCHQGLVIDLGVVEREVKFQLEQVSYSNGCFSPELTYDTVPVITLNNSRFICRKSSLLRGIDFEVAIPQDLAEKLKFCPHCNKLI